MVLVSKIDLYFIPQTGIRSYETSAFKVEKIAWI
jgi:hypothetical protein